MRSTRRRRRRTTGDQAGHPIRSFDPVRLGTLERDAWAAYYQRRWRPFLVAAVGLVRVGFGMAWPQSVRGAWLVLRANQAWAPYPANDLAAAQELMRRFYALVARYHRLDLDPAEAARREVRWWRVHRDLQHRRTTGSAVVPEDLVDALAQLYAYVYGADAAGVLAAARDRAAAMHLSDAWVAAGCDPDDPRLAEEATLLVRSYTALRHGVGPDDRAGGGQAGAGQAVEGQAAGSGVKIDSIGSSKTAARVNASGRLGS
jgi:hypothetical protein